VSGSFNFTSGIATANFGLSHTFTVHAFVKPLAAITADATVAGAFELVANGPDFGSLRVNTANQAQARIFQEGGGTALQSSTATAAVNEWTPITSRFNGEPSGTRFQEVYVDGSLESRGTSGIRFINQGAITVGRSLAGSNNFPGLITKISFWNTDISAAKIAQLSGPDFDPLTVSTNLFAYYDGTSFDDAGTLKLQDMSGNARHLVITGATASADEPTSGPSEAYALTDHGTPQANSMMEGNQFATTGPVYFDITGGDTNIANPDWAAINTAQLWLTDINDIAAFNPIAVGSVTYTIAYRVEESGDTGTFQRTVNVANAASDNWPFFVAVTTAPKTWEWGNRHPTTNARVRMFKEGGL
jgi:hypothetical protein